MIRYLVAGCFGAILCGVAGAILFPIAAFSFAKEAISVMMAGSGLMVPLLLPLVGGLVGALVGLLAGVATIALLNAARQHNATSSAK